MPFQLEDIGQADNIARLLAGLAPVAGAVAPPWGLTCIPSVNKIMRPTFEILTGDGTR